MQKQFLSHLGLFALLAAQAASAEAEGDRKTDAVDAIRAIRSVFSIGTDLKQFESRVITARVAVDRFLLSPEAKADRSSSRSALTAAMSLYEMAREAWLEKVSGHSK